MRSRAKALGVAAAVLLAPLAPGGAHAEEGGAASYGSYAAAGLASWYGDELAGARTASGARFDPGAITVAHRTLPLGSFVEITAVDTGRTIVALVNDRGPGRRDRLIDLSRGAAQRLGFGGRSVTAVRVRSVVPSFADAMALRLGRVPVRGGAVAAAAESRRPNEAAPLPDRRYLVQVASFSYEPRARALAKVLDADVVRSGALWRVRIGPLRGDIVQRRRDAVAARGYGDVQILPAD